MQTWYRVSCYKNIRAIVLRLGYYILAIFVQLTKGSGRHFRDLMREIDNIHLQKRYSFPKMANPYVSVLDEDAEGILIQYRSARQGYCTFLYGILIAYKLALVFLN